MRILDCLGQQSAHLPFFDVGANSHDIMLHFDSVINVGRESMDDASGCKHEARCETRLVNDQSGNDWREGVAPHKCNRRCGLVTLFERMRCDNLLHPIFDLSIGFAIGSALAWRRPTGRSPLRPVA
jgi:hypothetical protein